MHHAAAIRAVPFHFPAGTGLLARPLQTNVATLADRAFVDHDKRHSETPFNGRATCKRYKSLNTGQPTKSRTRKMPCAYPSE